MLDSLRGLAAATSSLDFLSPLLHLSVADVPATSSSLLFTATLLQSPGNGSSDDGTTEEKVRLVPTADKDGASFCFVKSFLKVLRRSELLVPSGFLMLDTVRKIRRVGRRVVRVNGEVLAGHTATGSRKIGAVC